MIRVAALLTWERCPWRRAASRAAALPLGATAETGLSCSTGSSRTSGGAVLVFVAVRVVDLAGTVAGAGVAMLPSETVALAVVGAGVTA